MTSTPARGAFEYRLHIVAVRVRDIYSARAAGDVAIGLAGDADDGCIYDRQHFGDVPLQQHEKERLVAVLEAG